MIKYEKIHKIIHKKKLENFHFFECIPEEDPAQEIDYSSSFKINASINPKKKSKYHEKVSKAKLSSPPESKLSRNIDILPLNFDVFLPADSCEKFSVNKLQQIINEFLKRHDSQEENLIRNGIFLMESLLSQRMKLMQDLKDIELTWTALMKDLLEKGVCSHKDPNLLLGIKDILNKLEEKLSATSQKSDFLTDLMAGLSEIPLGKPNRAKSPAQILLQFRNLLQKSKPTTIEPIKSLMTEFLSSTKFELSSLEINSKLQLAHEKAFCLVIQESYHELVFLKEIIGGKITILRGKIKSSENQLNLILLPFNQLYHQNLSTLESANKSMKKLEEKLSSLNRKLKSSKTASAFYQSQKFEIKSELKETLRTLEFDFRRIFNQLKLVYYFPKFETDLKALESFTLNNLGNEKPFSREFNLSFFSETSKIQLFLELIRQQPQPLKIITAFQEYLETNLNILFSGLEGMKTRIKAKQREEFQNLGSLKQEADGLSQKVQSYLERNHLGPEEKKSLRNDLKILIEKLETLSKWQDITDYALSLIYSLKTEIEKDLQNISFFEEMNSVVPAQITNPALESTLKCLKVGAQINLLKPFLRKLDTYYSSLNQIPSLFKPTKDLLGRVKVLLPCLSFFQSKNEEYINKFLTFSSDYELLREEIWGLKDRFLAEIGNICANKEDKAFFRKCGEDFLLALKKHYENLTPENIMYLHGESKHILQEIESRIRFFDSDKENLRNMAISFSRQLKLKNTVEFFFKIIDKLKLTSNSKEILEKAAVFQETQELLHRCERLIESLLKICKIASKIMEAFELNQKEIESQKRFEALRTFVKDVKESKISLAEERSLITDEQIESLYIYISDDLGKLHKYLERLVPDVENYLYYQAFFKGSKNISIKDHSFLQNLRIFLNYHREIDRNPFTHKISLFQEISTINGLIEETYSLWYSEIVKFLSGFGFEWLDKLYTILNILDKNPVNVLIQQKAEFLQELSKRIGKPKTRMMEFNEAGLFLKEKIRLFDKKFRNIQLSIFSLETLNKMEVLNNFFFEDLNLLREEFREIPNFSSWAKCFDLVAKVIENVEKVASFPQKSTYIIWRRALARLSLIRVEEYLEGEDLEDEQKKFMKEAIFLIRAYFFFNKKIP